MVAPDDLAPTLNRFIQSIGSKGEASSSYVECVSALANISTVSDKSSGKEGFDRLLTRLLQYGYVRVSSVEALLKALRTSATTETIPLFTRLLYYLVQLAMGCGAAGTPLPLPPNRGSLSLPKAVDSLPPEILSAAWADLSDEKAPFMRKQGSMRALAALAHAALVSKPDDPMYPAGLLITLERLLDTLDQLKVGKSSLASILAATAAAEAGASAKKKNLVTEHKQQMEVQALLRLAFSTARACLSKSGLMQIAQRSFPGITSPDAVCARHALALAALVAKETSGVTYAQNVGPYLLNNVDMAKRTGLLYVVSSKGKTGGPAPAVFREDTSNYINLKDASARIYLARGCAAAIQGGMGDVHGSGAVYWDALVLLGCADPSDLVALEAIRSMFGAPFPHAEQLRKRLAPTEAELQDVSVQGRMFAGSWQMVMSMADTPPQVPEEALPAGHPGLTESKSMEQPTLTSQNSLEQQPATAVTSLFSRLLSRVLNLLQSRSCSLITAAAKTAAVILESRAWSASYSGHLLETEGVKKSLRVMQSMLMGVFSSDSLGAVERCAVAEALVWLQLHPPDDPRQSILPPQQLLKAASQGGLSVQPVVKALFADPWPEGLAYSFLFTLLRRLRCTPTLAGWCCQLAGALAAGTPSQVPRDMLLALWDTAPGKESLRSALELLGSPLPPIAQPLAGTQVEVKALASKEEQAYEMLRGTAAWWIGEHINSVAGVSAWKAPAKASVALEFLPQGGAGAGQLEVGERLALAAQAHAPLLVMAMLHLQRHMLTASFEVKVTCAQALSKVAVRSPEPFRIQAYASLRAAAGGPAATSPADPLGLAPIVLPALEVLDAMYGGQSVLAAHCNMYGAEAKAWPPPALMSVRRRHEWLLAAIAQRIGGVPKDVFFPLGRRSRALLNPDETVEPEVLEADEDEKALDAAAAVAAEAGGDAAEYDEYADDQYYQDDQYYDDGGGGAQYIYEADPLAKWKQTGSNGDFGVAAVNWKGVGETSTSYAAVGAGGDEEDSQFGKVQYSFIGANEDEVTVTAGERVRVLYNMGDWMQVMANSGQQGIVPSSYIQLEEPLDASSVISPRSSILPSFATGNSTYYGQQGAGEYDMYGEGAYQGYTYDGAAQPEYAMYEGDDAQGAGDKAGGFDDFGATLLAAAEARAQAQARATERATQKQQTSLNRNASVGSTASGLSTPMYRQGSNISSLQQGGASSALQPSYSIQSSVYAPVDTPTGQQYAKSGTGGGWGGYEEEQSAYQPAAEAQPSPSEPSRYTMDSSDAGGQSYSQYAPQSPEQAATGGRARAVYEFTAETAEELSVAVGDELEVLSVMEDWVQVQRLSDGRSGLVPAAYVQQD